MKKSNTVIFNVIHSIVTIIIAIFFIYKGSTKMSDELKEKDHLSVAELELIEKGDYLTSLPKDNGKPAGYKVTMNTMKSSGFLRMIAIFQILAGILMIMPWTRFVGIMILLPIIFNIFFMHIFFDNRLDENIETGILLTAIIFLILFYYKKLILIFANQKL